MNDHEKKEAIALIDQKFEPIAARLASLRDTRDHHQRMIRALQEKVRLLTNLLLKNHGRT
jgi:hypothetical protein